MRNLKAKDLGLFSKIVGKMEVKSEIMALFQPIDGMNEKELESMNSKLGIQIALIFIENYWKAEREVFTLLSNLTEIPVSELQEMAPVDVINLLKDLTSDPSFTSFFGLVAQ